MGVNLLKGGGETYVDCGDKRPTESPTYNPHVYMFGEAVRLPIMALTCSAAELIEQCIISHCEKVFKCANQRPEGPGSYGDGRVLGIWNERPETFYLAPLQPFIATVPDYLREMRNTSMIQRATLQLRTLTDLLTLEPLQQVPRKQPLSHQMWPLTSRTMWRFIRHKLKVNKLQV